jgi:hypothetical protein
MRRSPIKALSVASHQDRPLVAFTDREVNRSSGAWHERDHGRLVALAGDAQCAVSAFEAEILDVGGACFCDAQTVEAEQDGEGCVGVVVVLGGEQEASELAAVHAVTFGRLNLGPAYVLRGVSGDATIDVGESEVATHGRQAPIDR